MVGATSSGEAASTVRHSADLLPQPTQISAITVNGATLPVPPEVINFLRSLRSVEHLSSEVEIKVFDRPFEERSEYVSGALAYVAQFSGRPRAVFLDPDTGLASKKPDATHVTEAEARQILVRPPTARHAGALSTPNQSKWQRMG